MSGGTFLGGGTLYTMTTEHSLGGGWGTLYTMTTELLCCCGGGDGGGVGVGEGLKFLGWRFVSHPYNPMCE